MKHADGNGLIAVFFMYIVYLLRRFGDDYTNFKACKKKDYFSYAHVYFMTPQNIYFHSQIAL